MLNNRQKRFCDEYLIDCNGTRAAKRAGYSPNTADTTACRLLKRPEVREYIDSQLEMLHSQRTADAREVMEYLTAVMRGEKKEQILKLDGDGVQVITEIDFSARERLKAAELLGKRYRMFTDKKQVEAALPVIITGGDRIPD